MSGVKKEFSAFKRKTQTLLLKPGPRSWNQILRNLNLKNLEPEKPGPKNSWTLKNMDMDPEYHGTSMGNKIISGFRDLCFITTMHNVICCLKLGVLRRYLI